MQKPKDKKMNKLWSFILLIALAITIVPLYAQASSKITGKVTDKVTGDPLPGANVYLQNTSFGAATDVSGNYTIAGVPTGSCTLQVSYLGYKPQSLDINVTEDKTLVLNFGLEPMALQGKAVIVTAQAAGQIQAINQQETANSIVNIVSAAKIQELKESNAAEAVGRLPGISLEREGGEGNKVVIRGLAPQYNNIQIDGIDMPATGREASIGPVTNGGYEQSDDRSVDLSMVSPYVLDGIEVSKTAMADQEANQLGGTVNFLLRGAPEVPTLNATVQGGYNELRNQVGNYLYVLGGGERFFDNHFGVFVQANLERTDRSSNDAAAGFSSENYLAYATSLTVQDISQMNKRTGGLVVLDYKTPLTAITLSSTVNNIDITKYLKQQNFSPVNPGTINWLGNYSDRKLLTTVSTLNLEQSLGSFELKGNVGYSEANNWVPREDQMNAVQNNAFGGYEWDAQHLPPLNIINNSIVDVSQAQVNQFYESNSKTLEDQGTGNLSLEGGLLKTDVADIELKVGGEYKYNYRFYNYDQSEIPLSWGDLALEREYLAEKFNIGAPYNPSTSGYFPYAPFIDNNYNAGDFKSGASYTISNVPALGTMLDVINDLRNLSEVNGTPTTKAFWYDYTNSVLDDYHGDEHYYAGYIMPTITMWDKTVTLIPGVRYEQELTDYTANRCMGGDGKPTDPLIYFPTDAKEENDYWLPMINSKFQITDWFDIRAAYTETLARPDFTELIPTWDIEGNSITWNNVDLKPAQSKNFDLFFSFYSSTAGLLSIGGFQKQIKGFIYYTSTYLANSSELNPQWPSVVAVGGSEISYINSKNMARVSGIEAEWQSDFWFLPGALRGLVLNVNYTYTTSRMWYPVWVPVDSVETVGGVKRPVQIGEADHGYYDRLIDQPTNLFNITVGYDYADFSIRVACQYKSNVFSSTSNDSYLRTTTDPLTLWSVKASQKLPFKGLQVYVDVDNALKAVDQTSNAGTGWFTDRNYYGLSADVGMSYVLN